MYGQTEFKLHGEFRVEVFNGADDTLKSDTDYFSNFITEPGLSYPFDIVFAECFKILHIGSGNAANTLATTGLDIPLAAFKNISSYNDASCGYIENRSGVSLYRGWRVPEEDTFSGAYTFKEFGVAPTTDPYEICTGGLGESNEPDPCPPYHRETGFQRLFARALNNVSVSSGDYALITYRLHAIVNTGIRVFGDTIMNVQSSTNCGAEEFTATGLWNNFTGIYRQIHHGLALVAPDLGGGGISPDATAGNWEPLYYTDPVNPINGAGKSFVPGLGVGLEPCLDTNQFSFYISSDGFQFMVCESGGKWRGDTGISGGYYPYDPTGISFITDRHSGLAGYIYDVQTHRDNEDEAYSEPYINMRRESYTIPVSGDFLTETVISQPEVLIDYETATRLESGVSPRTRAVFRNFTVKSTQIIDGELAGKSVRSILMGYQKNAKSVEEDIKHYPIIDALIMPGDEPILPTIDIVTGKGAHNIYTGSNQDEFMAFDICHNWGMSYRIKWTAAGP